MNYWLSRNGEATSGPYAQTQLFSMWKQGAVTGADQVCPTDLEDAWMPLSVVIDEMEAEKARAEAAEQRVKQQALFAQTEYEQNKKSAGVALALSLFLPMGGQFYAGAYGQALLGLFMSLAGFFSGVWALSGLIWLCSIGDAPGAVKRYNKSLAERLRI